MKKVFICLLVVLTVFLIYLANMDRKVYYLALGNCLDGSYSNDIVSYLNDKEVLEKYNDDFGYVNARIPDIIDDINDNLKKDVTIKNALIKADLVTLSINNDDVYKRISDDNVYDYIDDLALDLDGLFKLMRQYCKEDIVFINLINDDNDVITYFNDKFNKICLKYDVIYVDGYDSNISEKVINKIDKSLFEG